MPRRGRGGPRQGQPGKAYANRTDLAVNRAPTPEVADGPVATPAAGGVPPVQLRRQVTPDDVPGLLDPSTRPFEPVTTGAALGPGAGPEVLERPSEDEAAAIAQYLPALRRAAARPEATTGFKRLVRYLATRQVPQV